MRNMNRRPVRSVIWQRAVVLILCTLFHVLSARAWGPHPTITRAALDTLGANDALLRILGAEAQRLTNTCWMADFKRLPFKEPTQHFYADDFLLFPQATKHFDHISPEVKQTYRPYFLRALQALRMESPANAARWIGALLHFVEDTGSPPHAAEIRGGVHSNMENWVEANAIQINGYRPRSLGDSDDTAIGGLLRRMDGLIEFSKPRGRRLVTQVTIGNQRAVRPIVLECALETSRVVADLLHTLGKLAEVPSTNTARITGIIVSTNAPGFELCPARITILGTNFSTLVDEHGRFELRHLPAGEWTFNISRPGNETTNVTVRTRSRETNHLAITLAVGPNNLLRNADFSRRWVRADAPDCWTHTGNGWEGEVIPLIPGLRYELSARFQTNAPGDVLLRWTRQLPYTLPQNTALPKIESAPLTPANPSLVFTGSHSMALLQVTVRTRKKPEEVCEQILLRPAVDK